MIADMSVAPEIAMLAEAFPLVPAQSPAPGTVAGFVTAGTLAAAAAPLTVGALAGRLRMIAAEPERWWGLVRFDPDRAVTASVEEGPSFLAWLVVLPPGDAGQHCDCDVATLIAGKATEGADCAAGGAILRAGRVLAHGRRHWLRGCGTGYSISLHARAMPAGQLAD